MTHYNQKGEEAAEQKNRKKGPMGQAHDEASEERNEKANKSTKAKIGKASAQVAKTKRVVSHKKTNAGMKGNVRTVLRDDLKKAL